MCSQPAKSSAFKLHSDRQQASRLRAPRPSMSCCKSCLHCRKGSSCWHCIGAAWRAAASVARCGWRDKPLAARSTAAGIQPVPPSLQGVAQRLQRSCRSLLSCSCCCCCGGGSCTTPALLALAALGQCLCAVALSCCCCCCCSVSSCQTAA